MTAWIGFNVGMLVLLTVDLVIFHRRPREMRMSEAIGWSLFWIALALGFNATLYPAYQNHWFGLGHDLAPREAAIQFLTGYVIELSLSVDNLFVFLAIFSYFGVKGHYQHRVLFWGIVGAVVLRAVMILVGVAAIERFHWLIYILGGFLILTAIKLSLQKPDAHVDPQHNFVLRIARRLLPISRAEHQGRFFVRENGKRMVTSLFLVLLVVESTDVVFALDSIPAILAITKDPYIAYTSNIFAILGLRAMYFALAGLMRFFTYLRFGLAAVLGFVGVKMLLPIWGYKIETEVSLIVVGSLLLLSIVASFIFKPRPSATEASSHESLP